jgi:hypothetical protein
LEKKKAEQVTPGNGGEGGGVVCGKEEVAQRMYTHLSKCTNDKIKEKKKKKYI